MTLRKKIQKIGALTYKPSVTISLNTHRTHPGNKQDALTLKNLCEEAILRIEKEYDKREVGELLTRLKELPKHIDENYNLDSLHIFVSNHTLEIVKSIWPTSANMITIDTVFNVKPLVKVYTRNDEYMILQLSQNGAQLFNAMGDAILNEIKNENFPAPAYAAYPDNDEQKSDGKRMDNLLREYFNKIDKAVNKIHIENDLNCVVICNRDNYLKLLQVADKPDLYVGYDDKDYKNTAPHQIVKQAWSIIKEQQQKKVSDAIAEVKEAVAQGRVSTDLQEIYQAAIDGRGSLLIMHENFKQPVEITGERTFKYIDDASKRGANQDIATDIIWEVFSKNGEALITDDDEMKDLGDIVLKTRY